MNNLRSLTVVALSFLLVACEEPPQAPPDLVETGSGGGVPDEVLDIGWEDVETIPALPGLDGFEMRLTRPPALGPHPAVELAAERIDREWARPLEERIRDEITEIWIWDASPNLVEVACATTWCGIVVEIPEGIDRGIRHQIGGHLKDELGFRNLSQHGVGRLNQPDFIAIYLKAVR